MASVTLLTAGAKANTDAGSPLDCEAINSLRLNVALSADTGKQPVLDLFIETSATTTGPWRQIYYKQFDSRQPPYHDSPWANTHRLSVGGYDRYVRARWSTQAHRNVASPAESVGLTLGITGDGI